jgi:hypothetical protein
MTVTSLALELPIFQSMTQSEKLAWLTDMLCKISMYGRGTYAYGSDQVANPPELRLFNELIHRVAIFARSIAKHNDQRMPDDDFFALLERTFAKLNISEDQILRL